MHIIKIHQVHKNNPFQHPFPLSAMSFFTSRNCFRRFFYPFHYIFSAYFSLTEFRFSDNIIEQLPGEMSNISKILNIPVEPSL